MSNFLFQSSVNFQLIDLHSAMKRKLLIVPVLLIIGFFIYKTVSSSASSTPKYTTDTSSKGTLIVNLSVSGQVTALNSRTVTTTASGVVKKIYVKEGQKVSTGTPILEIDLDLNARQKLQSAYSAYLSAQNSLKSSQDRFYSLQSDLVNTKNIFINQWSMQSPDDPTYIQKHNSYLTAQAAFDNLTNTIKQQQLALESARLSYQAASSVVYAPISGTISAISLSPGMILNPTSDSANSSNIENKIAIVKTGATPTITVNLTEIDVSKVKVGQKATVELSALPDKIFSGKVIAIDTLGVSSNGVVTYPATIQLDLGSDQILSNMSATGNIILDIRNDIVKVPSSAVQTVNGLTTVRTLENDQLKNIDVTIGATNGSETEIVSGLSENVTVVTSVTNSASTKSTTNSTSVFSGMGAGGGMRMR